MKCVICTGINPALSHVENGRNLGVSEATVRRHLASSHMDVETDPFFAEVPVSIIASRGKSVRLEDGSWEKITYLPLNEVTPKWPVVDRPTPVHRPHG